MEICLENTQLNLKYSTQLEELSRLLSTVGINVSPYHNQSTPLFSKLSKRKQLAIENNLNAYVGALKAELSQEFFSSERFIIQFLFRIGVVPTDELTDTIKNEKFIQIYSADQLQIFRSLACYQRCSFTLEQMTTRPWNELWERDSVFYYACFGLATTALRFIKFTKLRLDFPFHKVREIDSTEKYSFEYKIKSLSALTRQGRLQAALLIEDWKF